MRNPGGCAIITDPYAPVKEIDTFTCCHCNSVVHVPVKADMDKLGSWCTMCMKMHCSKPACSNCVPFEKQLESIERQARFMCELV